MKSILKAAAIAIALAEGMGSPMLSAEVLSGVGNEAQQRAQAPGVVGPKMSRARAEAAADSKTKAVSRAPETKAEAKAQAKADAKKQAKKQAKKSAQPKVVKQDAAPVATTKEDLEAQQNDVLKVRAVAVIRGKGVNRDVSDQVRNAVEDALDAQGCISSKALDVELVKIRQMLINNGYYLSRILRVGPNGGVTPEGALVLHLQVGAVQEIEVAFKGKKPGEDGTYYTNEQVKDRFAGVKEGDGFNYGKLYLALYGLNAHPDLNADLNVGVSAGTEAEGDSAAKFTLEVDESMPLHGSLEINNYAVDAVDNWQAVAMLQYLNLTKADDALTIAPAMSLTGEQWSVATNYTRPFSWAKGGTYSLWAGYSDTEVDDMSAGDIRDLIYSSNGWFFGGQLNLNLIDTARHNLSLFTGLQYRVLSQDLSWLSARLSEYKVGYLPVNVGLSYTNRGLDALGGRNFASLSMTYNLLDHKDEIREIWDDAETHYTIFRAQYARLQPLWGTPTLDQGYDAQWTAYFRLEGQWSAQSLIPNEQLILGGHHNLRGYRVNAYAGDRGVYGTLELRTPIWRDLAASLFRDKPENPDSWIDSMQFLAFVDYGWIDREHTYVGEDQAQFLWSLGVGARLALTKYTAITADLAVPCRDMNENVKDDENIELYLGVRAQF